MSESPTAIEPVADPTVIPSDPDQPAPEESPTVMEPIDRTELRKTVQHRIDLQKDTQPAPPSAPGSAAAGPTSIGATMPNAMPPNASPYQATQMAPSTPFPAIAPQQGPPPGMPPPGYWGPQGPPPQKRSRAPWIVSGIVLVCVIALVVGGVIFWQQKESDDDLPELVAGQLTGSYPSAPSSAAWTVTPQDVGGSYFQSVLPEANMYGAVGAVHDGDTLVTLISQSQYGGTDATRNLVGVNVTTGQNWKLSELVRACSDAIVDHTIACYGSSNVYFVDTRTGTATATAVLPTSQPYGIAFNGRAAFVRHFDSDGLHITKVTRSGTEWEKSLTLPDGLPTGDSSRFTASTSLVASGGANVVVVSADDGREIVSKPGTAQITALPDGSLLAVTGSVNSGSPSKGPVLHVRSDGSTTSFEGSYFAIPEVSTPAQRGYVAIGGGFTSLDDKTTRWTSSALSQDVQILVADDRETVVVTRDQGSGAQLVSLDTTTGAQRWTQPVNGVSYLSDGPGVVDGERVIIAKNGGLAAVDMASGASVWSLSAPAVGSRSDATGNSAPRIFAIGDRIVTVTADAITALAPTGPRAIVPGTTRDTTSDNGSGDDEYVTACGSPPVFTPESFRTTSGGLGVRMKVSAQCPGGDILFGPRTRITIKDGGDLVASGNFDFSQAPIAVPSLDDAGEGLTMELTYPPGSFFRLPDTLATQSGSDRFLVDCDKGPTNGQPPALTVPDGGASAPPVTATGPALPAGTNITATSVDALRVQANSDRAFILANLNNRWVAQLSSKRPGLNAEGRIWDNQAILDEFLALRLRFSDVRLLYSDEWPVFSYKGWWVTVAAATFPGPDQANNWCRAQGFDKEHCFAKLVSSTAGPDGSTRYWS
ncbi:MULTISPECIES: PQQ-binding-like beta-propeller repeat protein [unclassified Gordonia (in: high G+C Gram-positive bacteria)]|uniref:outer membrane protein assembly factor BamB family protein n=1 Tax=unclassified Gordonia (in: high G+C Gram-positive bacteria) TaxID=2657482 RepID=UPI001F10E550|nr:PQQ-binding-like beta-propeller repeat protein [Gordonia sp. ABSL49_1]MCH5643188.1 PQQ-like beta-propeller repeat protein [Gordonia sp. ABSL49_1]